MSQAFSISRNHPYTTAVDKLRQSNRLMTYTGQPEQEDKPDHLIHGSGTILHTVQPGDVIIAPAEASKRGWVRVETSQFRLTGHAGAEMLISLLPRIGGLYARGASSTVKSLDLWDIDIQGGGCLRLTLEGMPPEAMKRLGELFEVLATVVKSGQTTEVDQEIDDPDETCLFMQALQPDGTS